MKLLLLGSTGLLGQAIAAEATRREWYVMGAARSGAAAILDVADERALMSLVERCDPDAIVNCAALIDFDACDADPGLAYRINARPLSFLADWSRSTGRPLVQVSTDHYYPDGGARPHSENDPVAFINDYARSKYAGEGLALTAPAALVLRTSILGIRGWSRPTFAEWALGVIRSGEPAALFTDAFTSSIDVSAFARAAFDLMEMGAAGLINLASHEVYSKADLIRELARQMGRSLDNATEASVRSLPVQRAASLGLDVSRAEGLLGYNLPGLREVAAAVLEQDREKTRT